MDLQVNLKKILKKGAISSEQEFQKASIIDRRMRLLVKEFPELSSDREQLRALLKAYEDKHWVGQEITDKKVLESDLAEHLAEQERVFLDKRKNAIKSKLKEVGITQKQLGDILGHTSATYMSELMNGINPFTLNDLIVIHQLLNIELESLIPTTLSQRVRSRVLGTISKLKNPKLKLIGANIGVLA
ncbi:helix-turn-helix domain-containing protein [Mucilaginibacter gotjawali]|uniref:Antitoxin component HigA of HigAB toxin-antitoxin module n=1 Tax=Mucilaginibacter gotjawali TaxID=1550579 RepID=A0A839SDK7_9SPHI|nr:helix-turn-helix transcriptional regulator [Mucilaginibacter gotjawali]MBB3055658.1 antitoxin component HigA of HigAB toxin-antitoxin module [Mucilaginibacter gotjawali]